MKQNSIILFFLLFLNNLCFSQNYSPKITKYVTFLETQNKSAKDYILDLFNTYDIVILCERHHGEMTQYDLIYDIVNSPYFQKNVGNIFTEIGGVDQRKNVQKFIHTKFKNQNQKEQKQIDAYRDMSYEIWNNTNFYNFIGKLNTLNSSLKTKNQLNLFVSDNRNPNAEETKSIASFKKYFDTYERVEREQLMSQQIIKTFDSLQLHSPRKKALVIMNYRHAFSKSFYDDERNLGDYIKERYGEKFANVLINNASPTTNVKEDEKNKPKIFQNMSETLIQDGKWDASFEVANVQNMGFNLNNTPFGKDHFDYFPFTNHNLRYEDVFTGFLFYLPIEKHRDSYGVKNFTNGYEEDFYKRDSLTMTSLNRKPNYTIDNIKKLSEIHTESSYENLDKLILMKKQWLK